MKKLIFILLFCPLFGKAQDTLKNYCYKGTDKEARALVDSISKVTGYRFINKEEEGAAEATTTSYYLKKNQDSIIVSFDGGEKYFNYLADITCSSKQTLLILYTEILGRDIKLMNPEVVDKNGVLEKTYKKDIWENTWWKKSKRLLIFGGYSYDRGWYIKCK